MGKPENNSGEDQPLWGSAFARQTGPVNGQDIFTDDERRQDRAKLLGLPTSASWEDIEGKKAEIKRQEALDLRVSLGLPSDASDQKVGEIKLALSLGLPANTSPQESLRIMHQRDEDSRKIRAKKVGLNENASWNEILEAESENSRRELAREQGLSEETPWNEIFAAIDKKVMGNDSST